MRSVICLIVILGCLWASVLSAASIRYSYDEAGRLVGVEYDGKFIRYRYDANGNLLLREMGLNLGDMDGDQKVSTVDALLVARCTLHLSSCEASKADVDCNHTVNIIDALLIARKAIGLPVPHWCGG